MAAALMTQVPGVSTCFCGSAVTYREATKSSWLGILPEIIESNTAESQATTDAMSVGVLSNTPEATYSAAITGHLGPGAEESIDGIVFVSIAQRLANELVVSKTATCKLVADERAGRQMEATEFLLQTLLNELGS